MARRRPKDIGTAAESAVVGYLIANGFLGAERRALRGIRDAGDLTGTPGLAWSVKAGDYARYASDNLLEEWLGEAEVQRARAGADLAVLVVARKQKNVRDWWALLWADQLAWICTGLRPSEPLAPRYTPVRLTLAHAVTLLRAAGWGDPDTNCEDEEESA